ncbi:MAG: TetR/AcrR family transcriptional regulator [Pseudomonadales bacterium]
MARPQLTEDEITAFRDVACQAALEIIGKDGVHALTVRALGDRLGCSYAKPYRYFGDKDQLIDAVRRHAFDSFAHFMSGEDGASSHLMPIQRYVHFALHHSAAFEVMFGFNQAFVSLETRSAEDRAWAACTQPINDQIQSGELVGDPEKIAHILWVALHGISTLALSNKLTHGMDTADLVAALSGVIDTFRPANQSKSGVTK